jgi:hypothetical protein
MARSDCLEASQRVCLSEGQLTGGAGVRGASIGRAAARTTQPSRGPGNDDGGQKPCDEHSSEDREHRRDRRDPPPPWPSRPAPTFLRPHPHRTQQEVTDLSRFRLGEVMTSLQQCRECRSSMPTPARLRESGRVGRTQARIARTRTIARGSRTDQLGLPASC